jgi:hypothetical protein
MKNKILKHLDDSCLCGQRELHSEVADSIASTLKSVLLEKAPRDKDKYAYCEELATCQTTGNHNYNQANAEWRKQIEEIFKD